MPLDMSEVNALGGRLKATAGTVKSSAQKVVQKSAKAVERGAKSAAPVGPTGQLQSEIYSATRGMSAQIISPTRYAQFVEFGTYKDAPQPYMTPALEAEAPNYLAEMAKVGVEDMRKAVGG